MSPNPTSQTVWFPRSRSTAKIVFVQPRVNAQSNYKNDEGCEQRWIPWFALLLSPIAKSFGLQTQLLDLRVEPAWKAALEALTTSDVVAISVITGHAIVDAIEVTEFARSKGARVIWGGPHVSLFPSETLEEVNLDAVVTGTGYLPIASISNALTLGTWPPVPVAGLRLKNDISNTTKSPPSPQIPFPDLALINNWEPYINADIAISHRTINYVASEGCPRKCTFCSEPVMSNHSWTPHGSDQSVEAIKELVSRSGAKGIKFHDANYFHDKERGLKFATALKKQVNLPWGATIHPADLCSYSIDELKILSTTGLVRLLIGVESPLKEVIKLAGKQFDPAEIPTLATNLAKASIRGMFTYIVGWPNAPEEQYSQAVQSAEAVRTIWPEHQGKIHFLEPWPGTPIFRHLQRRGFRAPTTIRDWAEMDYYQARYAELHDQSKLAMIRSANRRLSPYVDA